jgi:formylglycine-generating enzyme required for sulfatase activity
VEGEYPAGEVIDPFSEDPDDDSRVVRGGGWYWQASNCRSAYRAMANLMERGNETGCRVVMRLG